MTYIGITHISVLTTIHGFSSPKILPVYKQKTAHFTFEQELAATRDYQVTTETLLQMIPAILPSLINEAREEFEKVIRAYSRV